MIKQKATFYPDFSHKSFTEYYNDSIIIYKEYTINGNIVFNYVNNDWEIYIRDEDDNPLGIRTGKISDLYTVKYNNNSHVNICVHELP